LLVEDFVQAYAYESALGRKKIDLEVFTILQHYSWPGNVRELRNFIERLIIMTPKDVIGLKDIPQDFLRQLPDKNEKTDPYAQDTLREARSQFEREYLLRKLEQYSWNISLTAAEIGIERSHLHRKMKLLGIREGIEQQHFPEPAV